MVQNTNHGSTDFAGFTSSKLPTNACLLILLLGCGGGESTQSSEIDKTKTEGTDTIEGTDISKDKVVEMDFAGGKLYVDKYEAKILEGVVCSL